MRAWTFVVLGIVLLAGCATRPPAGIDTEVTTPAPSLSSARSNPEQHRGQTVRWGGTIAGLENRAEVTLVEVVSRKLESNGRPQEEDASSGRFLAVVDGFLDPAIYKRGRLITAVGRLDGVAIRKVGEYDYPYPKVLAEGHHLWEPRQNPDAGYYHDPLYWHDPWYRPWYRDPWYPHPYQLRRW
ncbi:MAG: Slp family lipoprotein [Aquisalimonadaceae bacterium]